MSPLQYGLGEALLQASVVASHVRLLGNVFEDIFDSVYYLDQTLDVLLSLDGDEILYFPSCQFCAWVWLLAVDGLVLSMICWGFIVCGWVMVLL